MQLTRLIRLMSIISDIKLNPKSNPDSLCARFAISHRQFYKDRDTLMELGFRFHFSRRRARLILDEEPGGAFKLEGFVALMLAVQRAAQEDDLNLVLSGMNALKGLLPLLPPPNIKAMTAALNQAVLHNTLKCPQQVLDEAFACIQDGRRVVVLLKKLEPQLMLDLEELILREGVLYLVSPTMPVDHPLATLLAFQDDHTKLFSRLRLGLAVEHIRKIVPTPFFSQRAFS